MMQRTRARREGWCERYTRLDCTMAEREVARGAHTFRRHVVTYMSHEHAHCLTVLGAHKYFRRNVIGRATECVCHFTSLQALLWIIKWRHCYDVIASKMRSSHFVKKNDKPGCNCAQKKRSQHPLKDNNNNLSIQTTSSGNLLLTSIANYLHVASSRGYTGSSRPRSDVRSSRPDSGRRMMVQCQGAGGKWCLNQTRTGNANQAETCNHNKTKGNPAKKTVDDTTKVRHAHGTVSCGC